MKIRWTAAAKNDRAAIAAHIQIDNPRAAARMDQLFSDAASRLADFPERGRIGKIPGTRELVPHENYRLVYGIDGDTVVILALVHTARQWPPKRE